jgi:hypothetical protein
MKRFLSPMRLTCRPTSPTNANPERANAAGAAKAEQHAAATSPDKTAGPSPFAISLKCGRWMAWLIVSVALLVVSSLNATLSEPDNVIYGSILIGTNRVTAASTDIVVEARRTTNGPPITSYRMGDDVGLGNFYSLSLKLESVGTPHDTNVSTLGQQVFIVVSDAGEVVGQAAYTFVERGNVERVDFGAPLEDADGNGLPDLWELTWLGVVGQDPDATALNGLSLIDNYVAGTDPENPDDRFRITIHQTNGPVEVAFQARRAEGPGYDGKVRVYTLESRSAVGSGSWTGVAGFEDVVGGNQLVVYQPSGAAFMNLFRGRVQLAAVQSAGNPELSIAAAGAGLVRLSWPSTSAGFALQENTTLTGPNWTDVTQVPNNDGTNWSVILSPSAAQIFYRLRN